MKLYSFVQSSCHGYCLLFAALFKCICIEECDFVGLSADQHLIIIRNACLLSTE